MLLPWGLAFGDVWAQSLGIVQPNVGLAAMVVVGTVFGLGLAFSMGRKVALLDEIALKEQEKLAERVDERTLELQRASTELMDAARSRGELALELQRLVDIVEGANDYISFASLKGDILYLNRGGRAMIGIGPDEDLGKLRISDVHPVWASEIILVDAIPRVVRGESWKGETALLTRDGREIPTSQIVMCHRNPDGSVTHLSTIIRDISDHKHLEVGLLRAMEKARAASRAKSEFLAAMSHEIRTPMNAIIGAADVLAEARLAPGYRHYVDLLRSASDTLLQLIDDILDLSKIEARRMDLDASPFSPVEVCQQALDMIRSKAREKGLELILDFEAGVPSFVRGDAGRLQQILVNLLTNAVKYTGSGKIALRLAPKEPGSRRLRFSVADTGPGIDPSKLEAIFDAFTQASPAPLEQGRGVGLGLAISRNLASVMGGKLRVESRIGAGSTFILELPLESIEAKVGGRAPAARAEPPAGERPLHILLAEDTPGNQDVFKAFLRFTPHLVDIVGNGEEALEKLQEMRYDLVFMDMQMPVMDGFSATRELRRLEREQGLAATPVVALTAYSLRSDEERCLAAGCDGYLSKPIRKQKLLDAIAAYATVPDGLPGLGRA